MRDEGQEMASRSEGKMESVKEWASERENERENERVFDKREAKEGSEAL